MKTSCLECTCTYIYLRHVRCILFLLEVEGNGEAGGKAVYVLAEIGQEKQLDVNHEAYMGYEEPIPLSSSSSLALVRLMVKGKIDNKKSEQTYRGS